VGSSQLVLESRAEADTKAIGAALAEFLQPGDVVGLTGDLGAGKTRLVQGVVTALGSAEPVLSPTFMIVREYDADVPVHHVDAYRLAGPAELEDLGLDNVLDPDVVVLVEWADRVAEALPESWLELRLEVGRDEVRHITARPHGGWSARMRALGEALDEFTAARRAQGPVL
jgi:tRNA threonylcarbamoyladenosine biosynthesis protein TsaE